jgi:hypothetical protein
MKSKLSILIVLAMVLTFWCGSALAQDTSNQYQMIPDDFGIYPPPGEDCIDTVSIPGFCFNPNFLPIARLFRAEDGTLNMQGNGELLAEVNFATEWAGNAVSPHRPYQVDSFVKYEDPVQGTMVPFCMWNYDDVHSGGTGVMSWNLGCSETRPPGYEATSLQCETAPFTAHFEFDEFPVEVPFSVCDASGILYVPAHPGDPDPERLVLDSNIPWELGGPDFYSDNTYDVRTYDATLPDFNMIKSIGGLTVGIDVRNMDIAGQISRVEIISVGGNIDQKMVLPSADVFEFFGETLHIYTMVIGSKFQTAPQYDVFVYDLANNPIQFRDFDGNLVDRWSIYTDLEQQLPPVMKLRKAVLTKNQGIRVKLTAPFDARDGELRLRMIDETGNFVRQFKNKPGHPDHLDGLAKDDAGHYFFEKKDGTVILNKIRVFIPMEYAGYSVRAEYRIYDRDTGLRGMTTFLLPAPEPVVEEEPEVIVTVECPDPSGLGATAVNGVCTCPAGYTYVDGEGCQ